MPVNVLAFGKLAEILNQPKFVVEAIDLDELIQSLNTTFPALAGQKYSIAVNKQLCQNTIPLNDGDEVALLPPFSGG